MSPKLPSNGSPRRPCSSKRSENVHHERTSSPGAAPLSPPASSATLHGGRVRRVAVRAVVEPAHQPLLELGQRERQPGRARVRGRARDRAREAVPVVRRRAPRVGRVEVRRDEVDRRAERGRARDEVVEVLEPHRRRPADLERGVRRLDARRGRVVERHVRLGEAHAPHLVPHLEAPARDLGRAVALDEVRGERLHEPPPRVEVLRRRREPFVPALVAEDVHVRARGRVPAAAGGVVAAVVVARRAVGERGRHERELDDGRDALGDEVVVHRVDVVPVVARAVERHAHVVVERAVEAQAREAELGDREVEVRAPVGARREQRVARAERALPHVLERRARRREVDVERRRRQRLRARRGREQQRDDEGGEHLELDPDHHHLLLSRASRSSGPIQARHNLVGLRRRARRWASTRSRRACSRHPTRAS